jgi:RNAse (barnase) inhibitor barstar
MTSGHSLAQLWEVAATDPENPLKISLAGFRHHTKHHEQ